MFMAWRVWRISHRWQKRAWFWLAIGLGIWWLAEIFSAGQYLLPDTGLLHWLPDIFWLIGYIPLALTCVSFLIANRFELTPVKEAVAIIGGGLVPMVVFVNFVYPLGDPTAVLVDTNLIIAAIYPALDILIATGGLLCLMISGPKPWRRPWFLIGGALALFAYTDLWYWLFEYFEVNEINLTSAIRTDVPYGLAYVLLTIGCWQLIVEERVSKTRPISDLPSPPPDAAG